MKILITWEVYFYKNERYKGGIVQSVDYLVVDKVEDDIFEQSYKVVLDWISNHKNYTDTVGLSKIVNAFGANSVDMSRVEIKNAYVVSSINDKSTMDKKIEEKIRKLLNLSLSSNENEAKAASLKAVEIMQKNSITEEDMDKQSMIVIEEEFKLKIIPSWVLLLFQGVSEISGCFVAFSKSKKEGIYNLEKKATISIVGKECDVLNTQYVASFYMREIDKMSKRVKKERGYSTKEVNDYRQGIVMGVIIKLKENSKMFFSDKKSKGIICVDTEAKAEEAKGFLLRKSDFKIKSVGSRKSGAYVDGKEDAKKINLQQAAENKSKKVAAIER